MFYFVEKNQKLVKGILIMVTATFVLWGVGSYLGMINDESYIVKVGKYKIYKEELDRANEQSMQNGSPSPNKMQTLFNLIGRHLLLNSLEDNNFAPSNAQIAKQIGSLKPFIAKDGSFDMVKYKEFLSNQGIRASDFERQIAQDLSLKAVMDFFNNSTLSVTSVDRQLASLLSNERYVSSYTIAAQSFSKQVAVSNKEITDYYSQHLSQYIDKARIKLNYIVLDSKTIQDTITPTESDIANYIALHHVNANNKSVNVNRQQAIQALKAQQAVILLKRDLDTINQLNFKNPASLAPIAKSLGLAVQTSNWVVDSAGANQEAMFNNQKVLLAIFNQDVTSMHNNSDVVNLGDNSYAIYHALDFKKEAVKPLLAVQEDIMNTIKHDKSTSLAKQAGEAYLNGMNTVNSTGSNKAQTVTNATKISDLPFGDEVALNKLTGSTSVGNDTDLGASASNSKSDSRHQHINSVIANLSEEALAKIFATPVSHLPAYTGILNKQTGDFVIYRINSIKNNKALLPRAMLLIDQLNKMQATQEFASYLQWLRSEYKISYNQKAIQQLSQQLSN